MANIVENWSQSGDGSSSNINNVAVSGDGSKVYWVSSDRFLRGSNTSDGAVFLEVDLDRGSLNSVALSNDDSIVYVGTSGEVGAYNATTGNEQWVTELEGGVIRALVILGNGDIYVGGTFVRLWRLQPNGSFSTLSEFTSVNYYSATLSSDGDTAFFTTGRVFPDDIGEVIAVDTSSNTQKWKNSSFGRRVREISHKDSSQLFIAYDNKVARLSQSNGSVNWTVTASQDTRSISYTSSIDRVFVGGANSNLYLYETDGSLVTSRTFSSSASILSLDSSGSSAYFGSSNNTLRGASLVYEIYWLGGSGDWNDESNWSDSSGGAGGVGVPTSSTDVFFDENSATGAFTVVLDTESNCKAIDTSAITDTMTLDVNQEFLTVFGDLTLDSNLTAAASAGGGIITNGGDLDLQGATLLCEVSTATSTSLDIKSSGTIRELVNRGGEITLESDITLSSYRGETIGESSDVINLGANTITISKRGQDIENVWLPSASGGVGASNATIEIDDTLEFNASFSGQGAEYGTFKTGSDVTIRQSNTFGTFEADSGVTLTFAGNETQEIDTWNVSGTSGNLTKIQSTGTAQHTLQSSNEQISNYLDIERSDAVGTWWAGSQSVDSGNNSGWEFSNPSFAVESSLATSVGVEAETEKAHSISADLTASVSSTGEPNTAQSTSATIGAEVGIQAIALSSQVEAGVPRKTYAYKVYDEQDNFIGQWTDVINEFSFSQEINSPGSVTEVRLARNSDSIGTELEPLNDSDGNPVLDDEGRQLLTSVESRNQIGPGSTVDHNYRVDVIVYYGQTAPLLDSQSQPILDANNEPILGTIGAPNGVRLFTGFISEITTQYGSDETTIVELTSFGFDLDQYIIEDDEGNTTVPFNSYDPANIVVDALEQFNERGGLTTASADVLPTGETESYTFRVNTFLEVIEKAVELAPPDYFYRVDLGLNQVVFSEKSDTPDHVFRLGVEIQQLSLRSYIGDVINDVYFTGGEVGDPPQNLFRRYTQTPASNTRRGLKRRTDNRVTLTDTADTFANTLIARKNRVQYRSEIAILDEVYDIESINLGDVVGFANFGNFTDDIELQVVAINYRPDRVTLTLDTLLPDINRVIDDLARSQDESDTQNNPDAPTVV